MLALIGLSVCTIAATASEDGLSLVQARTMSASKLATRLLGAAGTSQDYREVKVVGNTGWPHDPGLIGIDLYRVPTSAGFAGLCQVEGVTVSFDHKGDAETLRYVRDFYKFTRYAMLAPSPIRNENFDGAALSRRCATLAPVAGRNDPTFFAIGGLRESPAGAYFAMRALAKAQATAPRLENIPCVPDRSLKGDTLCTNPANDVTAIPIGQIDHVELNRCDEDPRYLCVNVRYQRGQKGAYQGNEIEVTVMTDAQSYDPPRDFNVTSISLRGNSWVV